MPVKTLNIDLNRVEGDLEFELDVDNGKVVDARCKGIMYRGFEQLLIDRSPRDSLVLTPRVCGICGTAHLYCAVQALEHIWNIKVPANATRIRNMCLMAENLQSDLRQSFLMFTPDFCNEHYKYHHDYQEIVSAFKPFEGQFHRKILEKTKQILEIVAIWGGQWPHSHYMIPGGVTQGPNTRRIIDSLEIVDKQIQFFEEYIAGCSIDKWHRIETLDELLKLQESAKHHASAIGLFNRFARNIGLHKLGNGTSHMLCFGGYQKADTWQGSGYDNEYKIPAGFFDGTINKVEKFDHHLINEHVAYSWYRNYKGGKHPYDGETIPSYLPDTKKYTWSKAPRYGEKVIQTGPLAEYIVAQHPLFVDCYKQEGDNTWLRQFARLRRVSDSLLGLKSLLLELKDNLDKPHFITATQYEEVDGEGFGLVQAARGSLGHWVKIKNGKIEKYQIVTPTAWNASPRDEEGKHGHWEQSVIGMAIDNEQDPVNVGHVVRSHDPCLVCTVHMVSKNTSGESTNKNSKRNRQPSHTIRNSIRMGI